MRKPLIGLSLIVLIVMAQLIATAPVQKPLRVQLTPNYMRAMAAYKKLEPRLPRDELRAITTIGIMNGARQVEREMEKNLVNVVKDLLLNTDMQDTDTLLPKIAAIEQQLVRDSSAIRILSSAMDLAINEKDLDDFRHDLQQLLQQVRRQDNQALPLDDDDPKATGEDKQAMIAARVGKLRENILRHVENMKTMVDEKIEHTLDYLIEAANDDGVLAKAGNKVVRKRDATSDQWREEPADIRMIKSILTEDDFRNNLVDELGKRNDEYGSLEDDKELDLDFNKVKSNRSSKPGTSLTTTTLASTTRRSSTSTTERLKSQKQEEGSPEVGIEITVTPEDGPAPPGGGGLVGIISGLSGGEGGSDIGALIGALTGVISTLFGPGGLDIEALIGTGTSLIAGLLAGNKNFGTVLGIYVGTALDGLSGGGGAINNGQFIGNFLGTVVASLSANPEEDDGPLQPFVFVQNVLSSFLEAKNRKASEEDVSEGRKDHGNKNGHKNGHTSYTKGDTKGGSDSTGFIKHIVSHIVGSALSLILNASLGASGGASHASSGLFHSSSHSKPHGGGADIIAGGKSWE